MTELLIHRHGDDEPIRYAAAQLKHYLHRATGAAIRVASRREYDASEPGLWLGTTTALGRGAPRHKDDALDIDVGTAGGMITGSNPRSVLLASYRYLTELGFRWVRPGRDGELVPALKVPLRKRVRVKERASYGHRVVCIEGASGWQHVRDMIDWLPKLGFNGYFVQFRSAYTFFDRWYRHELNPRLSKQRFTMKDAATYTHRIWDECIRRGMNVQMVGHGWTCEPFGVKGLGWYEHKGPVPRTIKPHLAQVNGRRAYWGGVAMNTNLCYGNAKTRRAIVEAVADYSAEHPFVDAVHLWLADGYNNHCECPKCRPHRPADLYLRLLNEVDAELSSRDLHTKIVFLIYVDLLWPPKVQTIHNPDRFILMFAPITRTYSKSFAAAPRVASKLPAFVRNRLEMPKRIEQNLAFLRAWQRVFKGDSFDFDYHLMWDHFKDVGHHDLAKVLHQDIRSLKTIGLNGFNSCQVQRCFLPSGLLMTMMGRTLWDRSAAFDAVANDHYQSSFGKEWRKVKHYAQQLSKLFDPPFQRQERDAKEQHKSAALLSGVPALIRRFQPVIESNLNDPDPCRARSWRYLKDHARLCLAIAPALEAAARDDEAAKHRALDHMVDTARRLERRLHRVFDVQLFITTVAQPLGWKGK